MKFVCKDAISGAVVYRYQDSDNDEEDWSWAEPFHDGLMRNGRYHYRLDSKERNCIFLFEFDEMRTAKQVKFSARLIARMFFMYQGVAAKQTVLYDKASSVSVHNTQNISAQMNSRLLNLLGESELSMAPDKVSHIRAVLLRDPDRASREILNLLKSASQMSAEYNTIAYLRPDAKLMPKDFDVHKVHTLLVLSFYVYEHEFRQKNIYVDVQRTDASVRANFNTIKTAFAQILENALKYCAENNRIEIVTTEPTSNTVRIEFEMFSAFVSVDEVGRICEPGFRAAEAARVAHAGHGYGMFIMKRMVELNNGSVRFESKSAEAVIVEDKALGVNRIIIELSRA
jgi:hypothetical protein